MSHYETTLKFINSEKFKKSNTDFEEKFFMLAIAREADKQKNEELKAFLSDEELIKAANFEIDLYGITLVKKFSKIVAKKDLSDDAANDFLISVIEKFNFSKIEEVICYLETVLKVAQKLPQECHDEIAELIKNNIIH